MASTRIENHQLFSCNFSPLVDDVVSCTSSAINSSNSPGALKIFKLFHSEPHQLEELQSTAWCDILLDNCWSLAREDLLVTACADGNILIWQVLQPESQAPKLIASLLDHNGPVTNVVWQKSKTNHIMSASVDAKVKLWDVESQHPICTFPFEDAVLQISNSPLLTGLTCVVLANKKMYQIDDRSPHFLSNALFDHGFKRPGQKYAVVGLGAPKIVVFEAPLSGSDWTFKEIKKVVSCDFSPLSASYILTALDNGSLCCIDVRYLKEMLPQVHSHYGPVRRARWIPEHTFVCVSCGLDGKTVITDLWNSKIMEIISHHSNVVHDVDVSRFHTNKIVDCSWDSLIHVFEPKSLLRRAQTSQLCNKL